MTRMDIYRQLMGEYVPIESEFEEGKPCAEWYKRMTAARERLCERTGLDFEDQDILEIISCLEKIAEMTGLKMYEYALRWGNLPDTEEESVSRETHRRRLATPASG